MDLWNQLLGPDAGHLFDQTANFGVKFKLPNKFQSKKFFLNLLIRLSQNIKQQVSSVFTSMLTPHKPLKFVQFLS